MLKTKSFVVLMAVLVFVPTIAAYAHHSFAATYQEDKKITVEGKVVQLLLRNPHSFMHIDVTDEAGQTVTWSIEGAPASQLKTTGGDALKIGDRVSIVCNPARSGDAHRGRLLSVTRPSDGWTWSPRAGAPE
jgi:Family of unknown function (DUF6152)